MKETRGRKLSRRKKGARGRGTTRNKESKKVEGRKKQDDKPIHAVMMLIQ